MHTPEIMNVLRTLNWLDGERRSVVRGSTSEALVEKQQALTRARLPQSLLSLHDRFAARGKPSVVTLAGSSCSACHLKLPSGELGVLRASGRYSMCPNCGVFVWSGEALASETVVAPVKKDSRKKAYA